MSSKLQWRGIRGISTSSAIAASLALFATTPTLICNAGQDNSSASPVQQPSLGIHPKPGRNENFDKPKPTAANTSVVLNRRKYDLSKPSDQTDFVSAVKALLALSKEEKKEEKKEKKLEEKSDKGATDAPDNKPYIIGKTKAARKPISSSADKDDETPEDKDDSDGDSASKHHGGRDWSSKKVKNGLKAMQTLAEMLPESPTELAARIHDIQEIDWAMESCFLPQAAWRSSVDLGDIFLHTRYLTLNGIGRGDASNPATNLRSYEFSDLSLVDPNPSGFWSRPASIDAEDLFTPYGRKENPNLADSILDYASPHKGNGIHPSFEVMWHDLKWKVKFDEEQSSGPFASRIFWALGFPVDVYDFAPTVKVHWDKRILTKFNSRELNSTSVRFAHIPIRTLHPDKYFDPFHYIGYAVMKDGSKLSSQQLRAGCFPTAMPGKGHPELVKLMYDKAFGKKIDYVVLYNAGWTTKESVNGTEVGSWDYNSLGHAKMREVRAMCVLEAWLDNWDTRWANNRLYLVESKNGAPQLKHVVSDLGALFGNSNGFVRRVNGHIKFNVYQNAPNDFNWTFTHSQPAGKSTVPLRGYMPDSRANPFAEMNIDDARWMARLIAQLTEPQIKGALIAAGYDAPRARLIFEKLVCRRDRMITDFGLANDIPLFRTTPIDRRFSYNPLVDGPFEVTLPSGEKRSARNTGEFAIRNGELVKVPAQPAPL